MSSNLSTSHSAPASDAKASSPGQPLMGHRRTPGAPWLGVLHTRRQIDRVNLMVVGGMTLGSLTFFGSVALLQILLCVVSAMSAYWPTLLLMCIFHRKPHTDSILHVLTMAMMVGLLMPVNSLPWQHILAGALLGICMPFVGRVHRIRMHPAVLAVLIAWALPLAVSSIHQPISSAMFQPQAPSAVLRPDRVIFGNVRKAHQRHNNQPWWRTASHLSPKELSGDAIIRPVPYDVLMRDQTRLLRFPGNLANMMASGELPRIEELIIGCVPGMIGATSSGLLIILGLYLMYRRLSWWSIPVVIGLTGGLTLMAMPVVLGHGQTTVFWALLNAPVAFSLTYLGYFFLTSPMVLIAFILAPATCPLTSHGRLVYCIIVGILMVVIQWFVQIPTLILLSVLFAGVLSRMLDNLYARPGR